MHIGNAEINFNVLFQMFNRDKPSCVYTPNRSHIGKAKYVIVYVCDDLEELFFSKSPLICNQTFTVIHLDN